MDDPAGIRVVKADHRDVLRHFLSAGKDGVKHHAGQPVVAADKTVHRNTAFHPAADCPEQFIIIGASRNEGIA